MSSELSFNLKHWCVWQSAESTIDCCWPGGAVLPYNQGNADVGFLPMMQRRRLSPLAKAACAVAWNCRAAAGEMPGIFYSAHGESSYYFDMLEDMSAGEAVSPSRFSLCVHNAIAGQFSLYSENPLPYIALAGGSDGLFAGFLEAAGLLLDVPQVMLVCYEQPLPAIYHPYVESSPHTWALAMVLSTLDDSALKLRLRRQALAGIANSTHAEAGLIQAILSGQPSGECRYQRACWQWDLEQG